HIVGLPVAGAAAARARRRGPAGDRLRSRPAKHRGRIRLGPQAPGPPRLLSGRPRRDDALLPRRPVPLHGRPSSRPVGRRADVRGAVGGRPRDHRDCGWMGRVRRHGVAIAVSAATWGALITGFGLAPDIWAALGFLVLAGAADMVSGIFRGALWN